VLVVDFESAEFREVLTLFELVCMCMHVCACLCVCVHACACTCEHAGSQAQMRMHE